MVLHCAYSVCCFQNLFYASSAKKALFFEAKNMIAFCLHSTNPDANSWQFCVLPIWTNDTCLMFGQWCAAVWCGLSLTSSAWYCCNMAAICTRRVSPSTNPSMQRLRSSNWWPGCTACQYITTMIIDNKLTSMNTCQSRMATSLSSSSALNSMFPIQKSPWTNIAMPFGFAAAAIIIS